MFGGYLQSHEDDSIVKRLQLNNDCSIRNTQRTPLLVTFSELIEYIKTVLKLESRNLKEDGT